MDMFPLRVLMVWMWLMLGLHLSYTPAMHHPLMLRLYDIVLELQPFWFHSAVINL